MPARRLCFAKSDPLTVMDFSGIRSQESTSVPRPALAALARANGAPKGRSGFVASVARSAPPARGAEPGQCCAQQAVEGSVLERRLAQQLLECGAHLGFAKTEAA